jgi:hypothetical protein
MQRRKNQTRNNTLNLSTNKAGLPPSATSPVTLSNCFKSRGQFKFDLGNIKKIKNPIFYDLPNFSSLNVFSNELTSEQIKTINYFIKYPLIEQKNNYSENVIPYSIVYLRQSDFDNGTVRLTTPAIYILQENIVFNPNPNDDFFARPDQMQKYPMGSSGPYHLGFFAAITVEADNILLDLNNKTLGQSKLHNVQQRFYANIELASSPFIPNQGPGNFGSTISIPKNIMIKNGCLGLSSHHGIHGNKMEKVILQNLVCKDFEVAGIALNGTNNTIMDDIILLGTSLDIKVLSTYSSGRFIRKFLNNVNGLHNNPYLWNGSIKKNIYTIISELDTKLDEVKVAVENNNTLFNNIFKNTTGEYDGNVYGIVLNQKGVVVNDFITTLGDVSTGNRDVFLNNITIKNIISTPLEIVGISCPDPSNNSYGGNVQVGPAGDVLQISKIIDISGKYVPNVLSNAKLIIGKYNNPKQGTTCVSPEVIIWAEQEQSDISGIIHAADGYFLSGGDSMAHVMKGNIAMFISSGERIKLNNVIINTVKNNGNFVGTDPLLETIDKKGAASFGIVVTGSKDLELKNINIKNVFANNGDSFGIMLKSSSNISYNNTSINNITTNDNNSISQIIIEN